MNPLSYEGIAPLLQSARKDRGRIRCVFKCPVSGQEVRASAPLERPQAGLLSSVASRLGSVFRAALGGAEPSAGEVVDPDQSAEQANVLQRQDAIVRAFQDCSPPFLWDSRRASWVSTPAAGDLRLAFDRQLQEAPVSDQTDRVALARMLVGVAKVDGALKPDEWAFLNEFVSADIGSVDDFMRESERPVAELGEVPAEGPVRESMLLLAWSMAISEGRIDDAEAALIADYAQALGVAPERAAELRGLAERHYLDRALVSAYPNGVLDEAKRTEVLQASLELGIESTVVSEVEALFKMRNAIV